MTMPDFIDVAEFRRLGYLQEVNRRFFHPLGLALVVNVDDEGIETISGVSDDREDWEGWRFEYSSWPDPGAARENHVERAIWMDKEWERRRVPREKALGYMIQPIYAVLKARPKEGEK